MTVAESTAAATKVLLDAGFETEDARRDASVLARHLLGWSLTDWAIRGREEAPTDFPAKLIELAKRRSTHEPVAYITGVREFYGRAFQVTPAVLIPRPETEILVETTVSLVPSSLLLGSESVIVDVGTGSGCVAITLALECPSTRLIATDTSPEALVIARLNADALGARVEFVNAQLIPAGTRADLIVSNPPYIPESDRASLPADVRDFEPAVALFAGPDGLDVIRQLAPAAYEALKPGGRLIMEIGAGQADSVADLVRTAGFQRPYVTSDLQGIPRIVVARKADSRTQ